MADLKRRHTRRGAALVETAIILPLLLVLVMGIIEYGWMILKSQQVANAARHGARVGCNAYTTAAGINTAIAEAMAAAGLTDSGYTVDIVPSDPGTLQSGEALSVTVEVPYAGLELIGMFPTPAQLRSTVVMAREGP